MPPLEETGQAHAGSFQTPNPGARLRAGRTLRVRVSESAARAGSAPALISGLRDRRTSQAVAGPRRVAAVLTRLWDDNVLIVDARGLKPVGAVPVGTLTHGNFPEGLAMAGGLVYVSNRRDYSVSVIDPTSREVVATIRTEPVSAEAQVYSNDRLTLPIAASPLGTKVFVGNELGTVSVIDAATRTLVASIRTELSPEVLLVDPAGTRLYVADQYGAVSVIDIAASAIVGRIPRQTSTGFRLVGLALDPKGQRLVRHQQGRRHSLDHRHHGAQGAGANQRREPARDRAGRSFRKPGLRGQQRRRDRSRRGRSPGQGRQEVNVGGGPTELAIDASGTRLYVTCDTPDPENEERMATVAELEEEEAGLRAEPAEAEHPEGNSLVIIDLATERVAASIPLGRTPSGIVVDPAGQRVFLREDPSGAIFAVDIGTREITAVAAGHGPTSVALDPTSRFGYVTNWDSGSVSVIDLARRKVVGSIEVGTHPYDVELTRDGRRAYVTNADSDSLSVIDTAARQVVATWPVAGRPIAVALNGAGTRAYVVSQRSRTVSSIDTATGAVVATAVVGSEPENIVVDPAGRWAYAANMRSKSISVIDSNSGAVASEIRLPVEPRRIALSVDGRRLFATGLSHTVLAIDCASGRVTASLRSEGGPLGIAADPTGTWVAVTNLNRNDPVISLIDARAWKVAAEIGVGRSPLGIAFDAAGRHLYVTNSKDDSVSVIDLESRSVVATVKQ